jgi:2-desacetyl-2-hydroxyethyl bacteriochlorophyllide A dehydrogenase
VAQATDVVTLPAAFAALDFPGEPLACACNVIARSGVSSGSRVAVVGVGFLGAVLVQLAAAAGAEVVAVSRRAASREVARACGAGEAVALDEATGGRVGNESFDVVIEATGKQAPLDVASALVRTRGRLVIAGFHQDGPRSVDMQSWNWRGIDVVNAHERDPAAYVRGLQTAVQAVTSGRISLDPLLTHRFRLDDVVAAFETASSRPDGVVKAVVIP